MEINQMKYFLEVCNCGSMAKAAEKLHITQQGISIALRRLESELGCNLFYHKSKSLVLTQFGSAFRNEAELVLTHVDNIYSMCRAYKENNKAHIKVALTLNRFTKLPPQLQQLLMLPTDDYSIELHNEYASVCADMVYDGDAVFGLVYGNFSNSKFDTVLLENVQQVFIVNRNHPYASRDEITVEDLDGMPLLIPDSNTQPGKAVAEMFRRHNAQLNVTFECNAPHQAVDIVSSNQKIVARSLADDITEKDLENVKVLKLLNEDFIMPFNLITKKGRKLTVYEQLFKHMIIDCYRKQ